MGANNLPSAAQMIEIQSSLNALAIGFIAMLIGIVGTVTLAAKWYIPRRLRQQTQERQIQINALKAELENKHAAEAVDLERERLLPLAFENNQRLVDAMIKSKDADTAATLQRIELDKTTAAVLLANTQQITTHSDIIEENTTKLEAVEKKLDKLYDRFMVIFPRETYLQDLFNELKGVVEETKRACAETKRKGDSKELPKVTLPPANAATILYDNVLPEDLPKTGTDG